jgi:nitrite reductase (NADH) large subunit
VDDSLGLGAELEAQMQRLVDRYECEWAATLKDEQALRRFRSLVNDDAPDEHVVHVRERGQIRPATVRERRELAVKAEIE